MPSQICVLARFPFSFLTVTTLLASFVSVHVRTIPSQATSQTRQQREATEALTRGMEDFKNGQTSEAEQEFLLAKQLDPLLVNARLYLAKAYASEYIPSAPDEASASKGKAAVVEFKDVLALQPQNLSAIDGLGMLLYQMAGQPYQPAVFLEAKSWFQKHTQLKPDDAEPYYWIGVIDWTLAFKANRELRDSFNERWPSQALEEGEALPPDLRKQYEHEYGQMIEEGIASLTHAISIKPDYDDAMAYLNLLLRRKADIVSRNEEREDLLEMADDLIDTIKEIKEKSAQANP